MHSPPFWSEMIGQTKIMTMPLVACKFTFIVQKTNNLNEPKLFIEFVAKVMPTTQKQKKNIRKKNHNNNNKKPAIQQRRNQSIVCGHIHDTHAHNVIVVGCLFYYCCCYWCLFMMFKLLLLSVQYETFDSNTRAKFYNEYSLSSPMCQRHSVRAYVLIETHTVRAHSRLHIVPRNFN